jgi:hypothetical protein
MLSVAGGGMAASGVVFPVPAAGWNGLGLNMIILVQFCVFRKSFAL